MGRPRSCSARAKFSQSSLQVPNKFWVSWSASVPLGAIRKDIQQWRITMKFPCWYLDCTVVQLSTGGEDGDLSNIICILEAVYTVLDRESDFVACTLCGISVYRLAAAACSRRICRQGAPVPFLSTSTGTEGGPEIWDDCLRINRPLSMPPGHGLEGAGSPLARTHTGTPYQKGCIHAHAITHPIRCSRPYHRKCR